MAEYLTPGMSLFVGGFVAALFVFAGGLAILAGGGAVAVEGFALTLFALGGVFLAAGVVGAVVLRLLDRE